MILIYIFFIFFTQVKGILTEHQVVVIIKHCEFLCNILCFSFVETKCQCQKSCVSACTTLASRMLFTKFCCMLGCTVSSCGWLTHVKQCFIFSMDRTGLAKEVCLLTTSLTSVCHNFASAHHRCFPYPKPLISRGQ